MSLTLSGFDSRLTALLKGETMRKTRIVVTLEVEPSEAYKEANKSEWLEFTNIALTVEEFKNMSTQDVCSELVKSTELYGSPVGCGTGSDKAG